MAADPLRLPSPTAAAPPEHALVHHLAAGDTGLLDVRGGKRRWRIWLDAGELVSTRSNIKSEQAAAIRAKKPGMSDAAVDKNVVMRQLRGALSKGDSWSWHVGEAPEVRMDVPGVGLLYRAIAASRDDAELTARLADYIDCEAVLSGSASTMRLPGALSGWLESARGPLRDWLADGPGAPHERKAAAWLAWGLGLLTLTRAEAAPAESPAPAPLLDIDALLGDIQTGGTEPAPPVEDDSPPPANPWAPDKVLVPPESESAGGAEALAPPPDFEEAEIEAIGDGEPVKLDASFFASLNERPDREVVRRQASSSTMHTSVNDELAAENAQENAPDPEKHPLEDELRALHRQISAAETHFAALDVAWDDGEEAFRKAHLSLAQKLHPDRFTDASEEVQELANETFDRIRAAWEVLGDEEARGKYIDRVIHGKKSEEELAMEQVEQYWAGEADFKRGLASFNAGRMRQAHELFVSAVDKVPDELEFRAYLGFTTFSLHAKTDPDKADEGKEMLKEVLEKNKEQTRKLDSAWVLMGRVFREQDNQQGAKRCFVQALKLNPSNGDAQRELRRLSGGSPGSKKSAEKEKKGFFSRWFGKK